MNIVFMNILFGIIIDTFAELRDDKQSKEEDMATCCFICGLEADEFEQASGPSFREHVKSEHNMWQYLYFLHHLRRKQESEYNGQESFVHEKIKSGSLHFFPNKRCLSLGEDNLDHTEDEDGRSNSSWDTPEFKNMLANTIRDILKQQQATSELALQQVVDRQERMLKALRVPTKNTNHDQMMKAL
jgi:hypothetical protein